MQREVKSCRCMSWSNLTAAWCSGKSSPSCIMQRRVKSCRSQMQRGVKSFRCIMKWWTMTPRCIMWRKIETKILGKILPLHDAAGNHDSPLHNAAGSQILPLHDAAGSQISPPHDAAGSRYWQREVKSKIFGRLTKTWKEQLGKKWLMRQLKYPISMRIIHVNSLSSIWNRNHKYLRMWIRGYYQSYGVDSWKTKRPKNLALL